MAKKVDIENLISLTSAAKRRGVSRQFIESLVKRGKLTPVVIDGHPFVYIQDVDSYESETGGRPRKERPESELTGKPRIRKGQNN